MSRSAAGRRVRTPTVQQMEQTECGAAALAMVLGAHGRFVPLAELRTACGVTRDGSKAVSLLRAARTYGLIAKGYRKEPAELTSLPLPAILFWNFNHFVVLEGFAGKRIYINDPATGPRIVTREEFDRAFTGIVLTFTPGPKFIVAGKAPGTFFVLCRWLVGSGRDLGYLVLATLALSVPGLALPLFLQIFIDDYLLSAQHSVLIPLMVGLAAFAILRVALTRLQRSCLLKLETKLALTTASSLVWRLLRLPNAFFQQRLAGELAGRVALNDRVARILSGQLPAAVLNVITVASYALLMFAYDWELASFSILVGALNMWILARVARLREAGRSRLLAERGKLFGTSVVGLRMIESLKVIGGEGDYLARWSGLLNNIIHAEQELGVASQPLLALPPLLAAVNSIAVLALGGLRVIDGTMSFGMLLAFQSLVLGVLAPLNRLVGLGALLQELRADCARLDDIEHYAPDPRIASGDDVAALTEEAPAKLAGRVELREISFGYDRFAPPLIENFSLELRPGSRVALVGSTGSGKSTIAKLVAGLCEPWSGEIRFDGRKREAIPRELFAHSLGVVSQEIHVFEGTVRENLSLWDDTVSLEETVRAARDACIDAVIAARPGGYDAPVDEGGINFSGGERQRLEIAAALVRNPTILVLDEATSALDPIVEKAIDENLRRRGCTCLIVAHRLSTIRDCDEIVVLERGRVVERGTHEKLMAAHGAYARLVQAEFDAPDDTAAPPPQVGVDDAARLQFTADRIEALRARTAEVESSERARLVRRIAYKRELIERTMAALADFFAAKRPQIRSEDRLFDQTDQVSDGDLSAANTRSEDASGPQLGRSLLRAGLHGCRVDLAYWLVLTLIGAAPAMLLPIAFAYVVGTIIPIGASGSLIQLTVALLVASAAASLLTLARGLARLRLQARFGRNVQIVLWNRLLSLPVGFFRRFLAGDLADRALGMNEVHQVLADALASAALAVASLLFGLGLMLYYDGRLTLGATAIVVLSLAVTVWVCRLVLPLERRFHNLQGRLRGAMLQLLTGIHKLRVASAEPYAFRRWAEAYLEQRRSAFRIGVLTNRLSALDAAIPAAALLAIFGLIAVRSDAMPVARLVGFYSAFAQFSAAAVALSMALLSALRVVPVYERMKPILRASPEVAAGQADPGRLIGRIEVRSASFGYTSQGPPALDAVSVRCEPGEFVAIVGPSGSGKSTLFRFLLGFERPQSGVIAFDGKDLAELDVRAVRRQLGVVLQHDSLIPGDVFTNIVGAAPLTLDDAWNAARLAGLDEDIERLPMGMHTIVSEGGATFSAGQRQRLVIARAVASRPRVLLLDEATSSLDSRTQALIIQRLTELKVTRIVIAQRLSTIMGADRIYVLNQGRVVQCGTYEELTRRAGPFLDLARRQLV